MGYAVTDANYAVLITLLKEKYGDQDLIREQLHAELQALPKAGEQLANARKVVQQVKQICCQLEAIGESTEERQLAVAIQSKPPKWIMRSVHQKKDKDPHWTVQKLRKHLEKTLRLEEKVAKPQKDVKKAQNTSAPEYNTATGTFAVNAQRMVRKTGCIFCNGDHWTNECTTIGTREARLQKATELRLCFKCLKSGHNANQCNNHRPCFHCKKGHNTALCPGKAEHQGPQKTSKTRNDGQQERWRKDTVVKLAYANQDILDPASSSSNPSARDLRQEARERRREEGESVKSPKGQSRSPLEKVEDQSPFSGEESNPLYDLERSPLPEEEERNPLNDFERSPLQKEEDSNPLYDLEQSPLQEGKEEESNPLNDFERSPLQEEEEEESDPLDELEQSLIQEEKEELLKRAAEIEERGYQVLRPLAESDLKGQSSPIYSQLLRQTSSDEAAGHSVCCPYP
uniref:CCHC-type domain-containing protein n=1 Tax=Plectus sambesii TaxID=2011161 RepID=A0A914UI38_9BILA